MPMTNNADKQHADLPYLEIRLSKLSYKLNEPIPAIMVLKNPSPIAYQVDGIYPQRQSANPPLIQLVKEDGTSCRADLHEGIPPSLLNSLPIEISPHSERILFDADLTKLLWFCASSSGAVPWQQIDIGHYLITGEFFTSGFSGKQWQHSFQTLTAQKIEITTK